MKKLFILFTLSLCSLAAWAYDFSVTAPTGQTLYYTIKSGTNTVTVTHPAKSTSNPYSGSTKPTDALEIPSSVIYNSITYTVTSIGDYAFKGCNGLTSVVIPNSVTSIGNNAFSNCSSLTSVNYTGTIEDWCGINFGNYYAQPCYAGEGSLYINGVLQETITIPNSVTTIGNNAFGGCFGLTSVTIPNSVISIGSQAFYNCIGLTNVVIGSSVTSIENSAFHLCNNLNTVYNLSSLTLTPGETANGCVAQNAKRILIAADGDFTQSGAGANALYQIDSTRYSFVDSENDVETNIPRYAIPANFLCKDGGSWLAKEIILIDDTSRFNAPVAFTADTVTYTREFTNSNRSTLYLPFSAAIPEDFEVYDFTSFANNTISFTEHTGDIAAYTPYLVGYDLSKDGSTTTCTITKNNAVFPKSESANYNPVTHEDMTFSGVISRTQMTSTNNYGYSNGFFVQSGGSAHVNPFRCYFTYTPSSNAPQSLPPTLNVEVGYGDPVGIDAVETPEQEYDGRYGKDVYDMLGRLVRKNADNLEGLPRGIYLWKGKKHFNN